jgi:prophage antirepressor-like protein
MFVGKDVAQALGYKNPSNALQVHVDSEDKTSYLIQVSGSAYKCTADPTVHSKQNQSSDA